MERERKINHLSNPRTQEAEVPQRPNGAISLGLSAQFTQNVFKWPEKEQVSRERACVAPALCNPLHDEMVDFSQIPPKAKNAS